jgi:TolA-binding protein
MFVRRLTPRNTFLRFARNFSETPSTESQTHGQPKPQTIAVETTGQTEAEQKEAAEKKAQNERKLQGVSEYKEALQFYQEGKYRISNDKFKRVLAQLEATERGSDNHVIVLKRY